MFTISCQKNQHNGLWCFDYIFSDELAVQSEPLMHQASALIDSILISRDKVIHKTFQLLLTGFRLPIQM